MPEFEIDLGDCNGAAWYNSRDDFTRGFTEAMFFTGADMGDDLEGATVADLAPETREKIGALSMQFQRLNRADLAEACECPGYDMQQAGRDFWYTSQGHGTGYWDGDLPEALGDRLTAAAKQHDTDGTYRGDDGKVYL